MNKIEKLISELCSNGVEFKELGEIGYFYGGLKGKSKNDFSNGNAKFITYMNVFSNIEIDTDIKDFVKINEGENQIQVKYGDVLFTGSSETPDECGMSSVLTKQIDEPIYLNSFCFGFRLHDKNLFLPDFLKYLFRDLKIRKQISRTASGVTRFNISKKRFAKIKIPLPPLDIQKEIVKILDNFTKLEAELEAELEARMKQYEYYRDRLLSFEDEEVEWKELGEVAKIFDSLHQTPKYLEDGYPMIRVTDIKGGYINLQNTLKVDKKIFEIFTKKYKPKYNDIVISRVGSYGNFAIIGENVDVCLGQNTAIIHPLINSKYLYYILYSKKVVNFIENKVSGGSQKTLSLGNIKKIPIPIPPLEKQKEIVEILDKFDKLVNDISVGLPAEIEARRKQYEYYRGKLLEFEEKKITN